MKSLRLISAVIALVFTTTFTLTGCIGKVVEETDEETEEDRKRAGCSNTETVMRFLDLYEKADEEADDYIDKASSQNGIHYEGLCPLIAKQMSYQINTEKSKQDNQKVSVTIENIDFSKIFEKVLKSKQQGDSAEEILIDLEKEITAKDAPKKKYDCTIDLTLDGDTYYIQLSDSLIEALYGGYNAY